jgi:glutathione S-transferase/RNA polymerase-associated protein
VVAAFDAAMASMQGFEMLPGLVASGIFKREYRDHRLEWMMRSGGADIVLDGIRKRIFGSHASFRDLPLAPRAEPG